MQRRAQSPRSANEREDPAVPRGVPNLETPTTTSLGDDPGTRPEEGGSAVRRERREPVEPLELRVGDRRVLAPWPDVEEEVATLRSDVGQRPHEVVTAEEVLVPRHPVVPEAVVDPAHALPWRGLDLVEGGVLRRAHVEQGRTRRHDPPIRSSTPGDQSVDDPAGGSGRGDAPHRRPGHEPVVDDAVGHLSVVVREEIGQLRHVAGPRDVVPQHRRLVAIDQLADLGVGVRRGTHREAAPRGGR